MDTSKLATKVDIKKLEQSTKADIQRLEQSTKADIQKLRTDIQGLDAKLDKLQNTLDGFVGVVDDLRTDNTVGTYHTRELQEKVEDLEKRINKLESFKHAS